MQYPHRPLDGSSRAWTRFQALDPALAPLCSALMEDPRFLRPAERVLGEGALPLGVDANRYVGGTSWHSDHPKAEDFGFDAPVEMECAPSPPPPSHATLCCQTRNFKIVTATLVLLAAAPSCPCISA